MLKSKLMIAIAATLFSGAAFANGILGTSGSTDPFNGGFQGTELWSDTESSGSNVTVQATYTDVDYGDNTLLGAGYDYKWSNGLYVGLRIAGSEHEDTQSGYIGYTDTFTDQSTPYWVELGAARLGSDYGYEADLNFAGINAGAEKRWGNTRLGLKGSYAEETDYNVHVSEIGIYGETPLWHNWVLTAEASRYRTEDDGYSANFNKYGVGVGKIFDNGIGFKVGAERAVVYGYADNVAVANLSVQF
jgi:hypothetical protein